MHYTFNLQSSSTSYTCIMPSYIFFRSELLSRRRVNSQIFSTLSMILIICTELNAVSGSLQRIKFVNGKYQIQQIAVDLKSKYE